MNKDRIRVNSAVYGTALVARVFPKFPIFISDVKQRGKFGR